MTDPFQQATERLIKAMNSFKASIEEADRCIRILAKKPIHDKQHPFKKFFRR